MKFTDIKTFARDDGGVFVEILDEHGERIVDLTIEPDGAETFGKALLATAKAARKIGGAK